MSRQFKLHSHIVVAAAILLISGCSQAPAPSAEPELTPEMIATKQSNTMVPSGPWEQGDQRGMANTIGAGTWLRCAHYLSQDGARSYELSHVRSNDMTQSPFGVPLVYDYRPTVGIPTTRHAFNGEQIASGEPGAQGTQMDALGHFAYLDEPWDGQGDFPANGANYYGGYSQSDVKPSAASPLLKLGRSPRQPSPCASIIASMSAAVIA